MNQMNEPSMGAPQSGSSPGSQAVEAVHERADIARDEMGHVAESAKDEVRSLADEARTQVRERVDEQSAQLGDTVRQFGQELSSMAEHADAPEQPAARAVRQIGDRVQDVADHVERRGVDGLIEDLKRFARQHPGQFIAGAAAAGFVVGRLVRNVDTSALADQVKGDGHDPARSEPTIDLTDEGPFREPTAPGQVIGAGSAGSIAGVAGEEVGTW